MTMFQEQLIRIRLHFYTYVCVAIVCFIFGYAVVVHADTLSVAQTVQLSSEARIAEGMVVSARQTTGDYEISKNHADPEVFGVIAKRPSLVFSQGEGQVPVVTSGVAYVQVQNSNGQIQRGDLLVTSDNPGIAVRAHDADEHVFAVALEPLLTADNIENGVIQAEIGVERAQSVRVAQLAATVEKERTTPSMVRGVIATVLVVGALFFVLYSFRSAFAQGIVSLGRNPRARGSIMTLSIANIFFALFLCAVVIFVAIAVLVLPV